MDKQLSWSIKGTYSDNAKELVDSLNISPILAQLLVNRGIVNESQAEKFINPKLDNLYSPWLLPDMTLAVKTIFTSIQNEDEILIFGDYDADGVTASTLMYKILLKHTDKVNFFIPDRFTDGYGLSETALQKALNKYPDTKLIITVDCGINSHEEINYLSNHGINTVITDHHEQLYDELPQGQAVINPKRFDTDYPFPELCGVAVAFKLAWAMSEHVEQEQKPYKEKNVLEMMMEEYGDLVSVGTVADLVPLIDENRVLVSYGIEQIGNRIGLKALLKQLNLKSEDLTAGHLGFMLGPRINAAGRLASAEEAVKLLVTDCEETAAELAKQLDRDNRERQTVEKKIVQEAEELIDKHNLTAQGPVLVVHGEGWHEGVIGIVASRLLEKYYRPVIVLSSDGGEAKGSCRSIPGFHISKALSECEELLNRYGGHEAAAGLSLDTDQVSSFCHKINELGRAWLTEEDLIPHLDVELLIPQEALSLNLAEEINKLEPYGMGNPKPLLACSALEIASTKAVGKKKEHLRVTFQNHRGNIEGIWFQGMDKLTEDELSNNSKLTKAAFVPKINTWGSKKLNLQLQDLQGQFNFSDNCLEDYRGQNKDSVIEKSLKLDQYHVVLVNSKQKQELLKPQFPNCNILRITDNLPAHTFDESCKTLLLYDLPYDPNLLRKWIDYFSPEFLKLLYNSEDKRENNILWKASIPYEQDLQQVYRAWLSLYSGLQVSVNELYEASRQIMSSSITSRWLKQSMRILYEMSGLSYTDGDHNFVQLSEFVNFEDLQASQSFCQDRHLLNNILAWENCFLNSSRGTLSQILLGNELSTELLKDVFIYRGV